MKVVIGLLFALLWGGMSHLALAESDQVVRDMLLVKESIEQQDWSQAEVHLLKVVKTNFKHIEARYLLGKVAEDRGELRLAIRRYKMTLLIDKNNLLVLLGLTRIAEKLNSHDLLPLYHRIIKLEPDNAVWYFKIAKLYMGHKSIHSQRYLAHVLRINPNHRQALELMVEYHQKLGIARHAKEFQKRLDELVPLDKQEGMTLLARNKAVEPSVQAVVPSMNQSNAKSLDEKHLVQHLSGSVETLQEESSSEVIVAINRGLPIDVREKTERLSVDAVEPKPIRTDAVVFQHYAQAAKQGGSYDQYMLALMYYEGRGVTKSEQRAVSLLNKAANQGLAKAQFTLALMLYEGHGVKKKEMAAIQWFKRAANQGLADAQYAMGLIYAINDRFLNEAKAVKWWRAAAAQHHTQAEHNLGVMYLNGWGVAKSLTEAQRWFQQEANDSSPEAQFNLDQLYSEGNYEMTGH